MNGIVNGGWNFVLAAYIVTVTTLVLYVIYALSDFRKRVALRAASGTSQCSEVRNER